MNRRSFLTSSLRGIVLGAAMSSGLGRTAIAFPEPKFTEDDPYGRRGYVNFDIRQTKIIVNEAWLMAFRNG